MLLSDSDQKTSECNNKRFSYESSDSRSLLSQNILQYDHVSILALCWLNIHVGYFLIPATGLAHFSSMSFKPNIWLKSFPKHSHCALEFLGKITWVLWFWCSSSSDVRQHRGTECIFERTLNLKENTLKPATGTAGGLVSQCVCGPWAVENSLCKSLSCCRISISTGHKAVAWMSNLNVSAAHFSVHLELQPVLVSSVG